ncbi:MAG: glucan biosynthesis protein G [Desulfuromonadaceae bacterium]|nr:glucan biosynthesis protein G [Desulfuromonadaceae bacterium]
MVSPCQSNRFGSPLVPSRGLIVFMLVTLSLILPTLVSANSIKNVKKPAKKAIAAAPKEVQKKLPAFTFDQLVDIARDLAATPYQAAQKPADFLLDIDFDAWRDIRFRPEKALWKGTGRPFEIQFFHPGFYFDRTVRINIIDGDKVAPLPGTKEMFDYGKNIFAPQLPQEVGFAGFRIHGPIKSAEYYDEIAVFLGASYLRAVGKNHQYGLSARGLAVDTARPEGEEFPWFREFWIEAPAVGQKHLDVYALLDSQRLTGAYSFRITPGGETTMEVQSTLFLRAPVAKLGLAPLTSMFFFGENSSPRKFDDFRPEVHDSDGLQVLFGNGEWLWRPLQNPSGLQLNSFDATNIKGFGLLQRDRDFGNYQDLEARYETRPGVWVEPRGDWGPGRLELVLIPTQDEIHDNIVTYWVPAETPTPGVPYRADYLLRWLDPEKVHPPAGRVVSTRVGRAPGKDGRIFVLDFDGEPLRELPAEAQLVPIVWAGEGGEVLEQQAFRNQVTGAWRLVFHIKLAETTKIGQILPDKRPPLELRAFLKYGPDVISETWSYTFKP